MEKRIKKVMSAVFEVNISKIDEKISPETLEQWDSLRHMNLIVALEEEFNIRFSEGDIVEMVTFPLIKMVITEKLKDTLDN